MTDKEIVDSMNLWQAQTYSNQVQAALSWVVQVSGCTFDDAARFTIETLQSQQKGIKYVPKK